MASIKIEFDDNSKNVLASISEGARIGMNLVMGECVEETKIRLPVATGRLLASKEYKSADDNGSEIIGRWGTFDKKIDYAAYIETGLNEHAMLIKAPLPDVETQYNSGKKHQQQTAAEIHYPLFVSRMKSNYR